MDDTEPVRIEPATRDRADTLADLWVQLADEQQDYGSHLLPDGNRAAVRDIILRHVVTDRLYVAVVDDAVVGFVTFDVETGYFEQDVTRGVIEHLYVDPDYRDVGIGSELIERAERALLDRSVDVVSLEVMADNDAARRFYRRHGYRPHRTEMEKSAQSDTHSKGKD
jgi:ribosomal protein S18 acetylase RimI-like enzyme